MAAKLQEAQFYHIKGERCAGGKKAKDRISVLVGASMAGDKMPLLVIGRFAKPRPFKNQEVPLDYEANARAWMTEIENTQEDEELNHLWIEFQDKCGFTGAGLFDYIDMDRNLATTSQQPILF
ncbi:DDE superfamily endonuclease domain-containing protein [Ditylenchus destructor]|uniref:DDE superfamily endonuclease domain-containing protein n=1 Tax=Ditylenchus destructor TaxID=166010 RepID=A0AAD4MNA1_9BILA|nr:DDE superfamily endonuclease domain-containing protein [Ditylenchus destructor]